MKTFTCPQHIQDMFLDEATKPEGRKQAVEWLKSIRAEAIIGDELLLPDGRTGQLVVWIKTNEGVN